MSIIKKHSSMGRLKKIAIVTAILLALYTLIGFLLLPPIIKSVAEKKLSEILDRQVTIKKVKLNPYVFSVTVNGLIVKEQDKQTDFASFETLYANLQSTSIFKLAPVVKEFRLEKPYVRLVRNTIGNYNFSDLLDKSGLTKPAKEKTASGPEYRPPDLFINNIRIINGHANLVDKPLNKTHKITELNLGLPFISSIGPDVEIFVEPKFSMRLNGTPVLLLGKSKPFSKSRHSDLEFNLKDIDLAHYFPYVPMKTNFRISKGFLDVNLKLSYKEAGDQLPEHSVSGNLSIKDLVVVDTANRPEVKLDLLQVNLGPSRFIDRKVHIKEIKVQSIEATIIKDKAGKLNIYSLFPEAEKPVDDPKPPLSFSLLVDKIHIDDSRVLLSGFSQAQGTDTPDKTDLFKLSTFTIANTAVDSDQKRVTVGDISTHKGLLQIRRLKDGQLNIQSLAPPKVPGNKPATGAEKESSWTAVVKKLSVNEYTIDAEGLVPKQSGNFTLSDIRLEGREISTQVNTRGKIDLSCKLNKTAAILAKGEVGIQPVIADLEVNVNDLSLPWFQPFMPDKLEIVVTDGKLSAQGEALASYSETTGLKATYNGGTTVTRLATMDKTRTDDIVKWEQLRVSGIDAGLSPMYANIGDITLEKLYGRVIVNADGSINLLNIVKTEEKDSSAEPAQKKTVSETKGKIPINIDTVTLRGGTFHFLDRSMIPKYSANLTDINATLKELSSEGTQRADLDIQCKLDNYAPLKISGTFNPIPETLFADLKVQLKNMDLSTVSPYAGKYVGYKIQKGIYSMDAHHHIDQKELDSNSHVIIDQFEFGDSVDSPDALNVPVKLGVSLLKNRDGKIDLNLPIKGRIDDPEFKLRGIVLKALMNTLVSAATSPFDIISSALGSDENYSYFEFHAGRAELTESEKQKLDTMAKVLYDRPGLELEISGFVDIEKDSQQLIKWEIDRQIREQKLKETSTDGDPNVSAGIVVLTSEEYETYLRKLFDAGNFEKPNDMQKTAGDRKESEDAAADKEIAVPEMEAIILESIQVTDDDLRTLAQERAKTVRKQLLESGKIEPERLFLVNPKVLTPEKIEGVENSRVDVDFKK